MHHPYYHPPHHHHQCLHHHPDLHQCHIQVEVQELAESGEYSAVEVQQSTDCGCGGVIQLRQVGSPLWGCNGCSDSLVTVGGHTAQKCGAA